MKEMTPRQRVLAVLRGEPTDKVPFTIYENKIPQCATERRLRNEGMCIVNRNFPPFKRITPNCVTEMHQYVEDGKIRNKTITRTPVGEIDEISEPAGYTFWRLTHPFKTPADYKVLRFIEEDAQYVPAYDEFIYEQAWRGDDVLLRADVGQNPLHRIMYFLMDVETFSIEWMENRDEILALAAIMRKNVIKAAHLVADSPVVACNLGGNETPEVMGPKRYREFCIPLLNEVSEILSAKGKVLSSHMDGNNKAWAKDLAESKMPCIEAFSPSPATDMTMAEAVTAWPNKILWTNFPPSVHLSGVQKVKEKTQEILDAAGKTGKLIMCVTEDIHPDYWQQGLLAVSEVMNSYKV